MNMFLNERNHILEKAKQKGLMILYGMTMVQQLPMSENFLNVKRNILDETTKEEIMILHGTMKMAKLRMGIFLKERSKGLEKVG